MVIAFLVISQLVFADENCSKWFAATGIKPNSPNCEASCSSTIVDMDSFSCTNQCDILCKTNLPKPAIKPLSYLKRLTDGDKTAISKYPKEAIQVFAAKEKADDLTIKVFKKEGKNDESDAFRHFVWSALLVKELGVEKAKYFLDAHENDPSQPKQEKDMDIKNNQRGVDYAVKNINDKQSLELNKIEQAALDELRNKQLVVLSPKFKNIPDGYYSK